MVLLTSATAHPEGLLHGIPRHEHSFVTRVHASEHRGSITGVSFASLPTALAVEIDRTASTAPAEAEEITVELAITADGRVALTPRQASDTAPTWTSR